MNTVGFRIDLDAQGGTPSPWRPRDRRAAQAWVPWPCAPARSAARPFGQQEMKAGWTLPGAMAIRGDGRAGAPGSPFNSGGHEPSAAPLRTMRSGVPPRGGAWARRGSQMSSVWYPPAWTESLVSTVFSFEVSAGSPLSGSLNPSTCSPPWASHATERSACVTSTSASRQASSTRSATRCFRHRGESLALTRRPWPDCVDPLAIEEVTCGIQTSKQALIVREVPRHRDCGWPGLVVTQHRDSPRPRHLAPPPAWREHPTHASPHAFLDPPFPVTRRARTARSEWWRPANRAQAVSLAGCAALGHPEPRLAVADRKLRGRAAHRPDELRELFIRLE